MIKEIAKTSPKKYGRYFLSTEAPGDEEELETPVKSNTKVIDVKPNNRRRLDFTDGAEEIEEDIPEEPSEEEPVGQDLDFDTGYDQDFNQDDGTPIDRVDDGTDPTVVDDTTGDVDTTQDQTNADPTAVDPTQDQTNTDPTTVDPNMEPTVDGGEGDITMDDPNGPDVSDGEDFTADASVDDGSIPQDGATPVEQKKGPGLEYDSTRKYQLFENYVSLSNALTNYITKLENNMGDNYEENLILKTSTEKLREIYQLCYDYMTMKFELSSYVQSLLFFQNLIIMVQLVFDLLSKTKKKLKK